MISGSLSFGSVLIGEPGISAQPKDKTPIHDIALNEFILSGGQRNAPLKSAIRDFQPLDDRRFAAAAQGALAHHQQYRSFERDLDPARIHAGHGHFYEK